VPQTQSVSTVNVAFPSIAADPVAAAALSAIITEASYTSVSAALASASTNNHNSTQQQQQQQQIAVASAAAAAAAVSKISLYLDQHVRKHVSSASQSSHSNVNTAEGQTDYVDITATSTSAPAAKSPLAHSAASLLAPVAPLQSSLLSYVLFALLELVYANAVPLALLALSTLMVWRVVQDVVAVRRRCVDKQGRSVSAEDVVSYRVDYWLSYSIWSKPVLLIGLILLLVTLGGIVFAVVTGDTLPAAMWQVWLLIVDTGAHGEFGPLHHRVIGLVMTCCGMVVFGFLVGIVTEVIADKVDQLKKGRSRVIERNHTLICNWSDKTIPVISEICIANESLGGGTIVLLADEPKQDLEHRVAEAEINLRGSKVVVRSGSPIMLGDLKKVSAQHARSVVVLAREAELAPDESDAMTLRTVVSLMGLGAGHTVCELRDVDNRDIIQIVGKKRVECVVAHDIIGRIMIQAALQPGLALILERILGFQGSESYLKEFPELVGLTFAQVTTLFYSAVVIGIRKADPDAASSDDDDDDDNAAAADGKKGGKNASDGETCDSDDCVALTTDDGDALRPFARSPSINNDGNNANNVLTRNSAANNNASATASVYSYGGSSSGASAAAAAAALASGGTFSYTLGSNPFMYHRDRTTGKIYRGFRSSQRSGAAAAGGKLQRANSTNSTGAGGLFPSKGLGGDGAYPFSPTQSNTAISEEATLALGGLGAAPRAPRLLWLNPPLDTVLEKGDQVVVLAEDDDSYWPDEQRLAKLRAEIHKLNASNSKAVVGAKKSATAGMLAIDLNAPPSLTDVNNNSNSSNNANADSNNACKNTSRCSRSHAHTASASLYEPPRIKAAREWMRKHRSSSSSSLSVQPSPVFTSADAHANAKPTASAKVPSSSADDDGEHTLFERRVTHLLFMGWRRDIDDMIIELDGYVGPGSTLTLLSEVPIAQRELALALGGLDVRRLTNVELRHSVGSPLSRRHLSTLDMTSFDSVLILADETYEQDVAKMDSRSLTSLLLVRDMNELHETQLVERLRRQGGSLVAAAATARAEAEAGLGLPVLRTHHGRTVSTSSFADTSALSGIGAHAAASAAHSTHNASTVLSASASGLLAAPAAAVAGESSAGAEGCDDGVSSHASSGLGGLSSGVFMGRPGIARARSLGAQSHSFPKSSSASSNVATTASICDEDDECGNAAGAAAAAAAAAAAGDDGSDLVVVTNANAANDGASCVDNGKTPSGDIVVASHDCPGSGVTASVAHPARSAVAVETESDSVASAEVSTPLSQHSSITTTANAAAAAATAAAASAAATARVSAATDSAATDATAVSNGNSVTFRTNSNTTTLTAPASISFFDINAVSNTDSAANTAVVQGPSAAEQPHQSLHVQVQGTTTSRPIGDIIPPSLRQAIPAGLRFRRRLDSFDGSGGANAGSNASGSGMPPSLNRHSTVALSNSAYSTAKRNADANGSATGNADGKGISLKDIALTVTQIDSEQRSNAHSNANSGANGDSEDMFSPSDMLTGAGLTVISEILDSRTKLLVSQGGSSDYVASNELVSKVLAMVAEEKAIAELLNELFSAEGNEIYMRPARLYAELGEKASFWEVSARALVRGEVAFGYLRRPGLSDGEQEKADGEEDLGAVGYLMLNPTDKGRLVTWGREDMLVVICSRCGNKVY